MAILEILGKVGFDWQVALANLVNFLIIFWILKRYAFGPISQVIEERKNAIDKGLKQAEASAIELDKAKAKAKSLTHEARLEAETIINDARERAKVIASESADKTNREANELMERAESRIQARRAQLAEELEQHTAELVSLGVKRVLKEKMTVKQSSEFTEREIAGVK